MTRIRTTLQTGAVATAITLAVGGCDTLTVPDFNNPGLDELTQNPSRSAVVTAAQGLMIGARSGIAGFNRYVSVLGVLGRESYIFDGSDPRFITELLQGPLDPGGASFGGGGHWADRYQNIRNASILLDALNAASNFFATAELEAIRGYAKTLQAHDLLLVINTRHDFGAPIDVNRDPTEPPAPVVSRDDVMNRVVSLLEDAWVHLQAGSATFPFSLSSGFDGFDTPTTFATFNRALLARAHVYREDWGSALDALDDSFLDASSGQGVSGLEVGVYHAFSTGPGDQVNDLFGRRDVLPAHPSVVADAQTGDARVDQKTTVSSAVTDPGGTFDLSSDRLFTVYGSLSAGIPMIRNEELILLRAEARLRSGDAADALDDINLIREESAGLAPIGVATWNGLTDDERVNELLYQRRYSLLFEGHRWIDMRRYDRLDALPVDHPTFVRFPQFPFPANECVGRDPAPTGCTQVAGF